MCFSSILWLMVVDCLSVFLFRFNCLSSFVGERFSFVYFLFFHVFFRFSPSNIPYSSCSMFCFFNLPTPGLCESSYTKRNSTHIVLYIWKIWRSWERQGWIFQVPSFALPYPIGGQKGWHLRQSVCTSFFVRPERNGIFLWHYVCVR